MTEEPMAEEKRRGCSMAEPRIGHVGLNVTDIDRSLDFYTYTLGFRLISDGTGAEEPSRRFAMLGRDGKVLLTLWQQAAGEYAPGGAGLHHLAFEVDTVEQVRAIERLLVNRGVRFGYEGLAAHSEGASSGGIFFHDLDGIRLEIFASSGAEDAPAPSGTEPTCGFF
jgi:lactoylglutathione lyase